MLGKALRPAIAVGNADALRYEEMSLLMMSGESTAGLPPYRSNSPVSSHPHHASRAQYSPFVRAMGGDWSDHVMVSAKAVASHWKRRKALAVGRFAGTHVPEKIAQAQQNLKELRQIMDRCVYESY